MYEILRFSDFYDSYIVIGQGSSKKEAEKKAKKYIEKGERTIFFVKLFYFLLWRLKKDATDETDNRIKLSENNFFYSGGYLFALDKRQNVQLKKIARGGCIMEAARAFRGWLMRKKIPAVRIEGKKSRYAFLSRAFPLDSFAQDTSCPGRDVFFVRLCGRN